MFPQPLLETISSYEEVQHSKKTEMGKYTDKNAFLVLQASEHDLFGVSDQFQAQLKHYNHGNRTELRALSDTYQWTWNSRSYLWWQLKGIPIVIYKWNDGSIKVIVFFSIHYC